MSRERLEANARSLARAIDRGELSLEEARAVIAECLGGDPALLAVLDALMDRTEAELAALEARRAVGVARKS